METDWLKILRQRFPSGVLFNGNQSSITRDTEYLVECPFCGHRIIPKQMHSSFNVMTGAFFCFVCGVGGSDNRKHIRDFLSGGEMAKARSVRIDESKGIVTHHWLQAPVKSLQYMTQDVNEALRKWREYEPAVSMGIVFRNRLGYTQNAIVYPIYHEKEIVGFRPRQNGKWMNVKGSKTVLFGIENVVRGGVVIFVESPVSAMLGNYYFPEACWVAPTSGAGTNIKAAWAWRLKELEVRVAAFYDNDDAGSKGTSKIITAFGNDTPFFVYPEGTPPKYDARDVISRHAAGDMSFDVAGWIKTVGA